MPSTPVLLDTDTLSELSRANPAVTARARAYLMEFGRLTVSAVTVFERLRGYRQAIRAGKPYERQMHAFEVLARSCVVLPFDDVAADVAATIWASCSRSQRNQLGDILIAATAVARLIPLVTRNRKDFDALGKQSGAELHLVDWTKPVRGGTR